MTISERLLEVKVALEPVSEKLKQIERELPEKGATRMIVEICWLKVEAVEIALDREAGILQKAGVE